MNADAAPIEIRTASRKDLDLVAEWAAQEGWNPGVADGDCYYAADPGRLPYRLSQGRPRVLRFVGVLRGELRVFWASTSSGRICALGVAARRARPILPAPGGSVEGSMAD